MDDSAEKQLISSISLSWNDNAGALLGSSSNLSLLALSEVSGDSMASALAAANTWSAAFAVECSGAATGVLICLFKSEDGEEIDRLVKQEGDGLPRPGVRALIANVLKHGAIKRNGDLAEEITLGPTSYIDLSLDENKLTSMVGEVAHIGTFSLSIGDEINSQALVICAPEGSIEGIAPALTSASAAATSAATAAEVQPEAIASGQSATTPASSPSPSRRSGDPANIERLLDVELDVVVRFGITNMPLRDVVRMGVGTMIELNRTVEEPVELLVNGRQLARGEVVVVDGYYGVRITEIGPASERVASVA